jgi:hypothetical protein
MNTEQLISKKVKHNFNKKLKQVLFDVISLEEHFDGLLIHKSDIIYLEEGELVNGYVKAGDVNMDDAVSKEFVEKDDFKWIDPKVLIKKHAENFSWKEGIVDSEVALVMSFEEAEQLVNTGHLIALPEWKGFWFKNLKTNELLVLTKEGEITKSIFDEFKERNDWKVVNPTEEQAELLEDYWEAFENSLKENTKTPQAVLEIEVTAETLNDNPELVAEGIVAGETITVDAVETIEEIIPAKVVKKKTSKKQ